MSFFIYPIFLAIGLNNFLKCIISFKLHSGVLQTQRKQKTTCSKLSLKTKSVKLIKINNQPKHTKFDIVLESSF